MNTTVANRYLTTPRPLSKCATGIAGFDEITGGGLPAGRTTLLVGGPGAGKTMFALQALVNGARLHNEPGIFVAFEENARQLRDNALTFGWDLEALEQERLFFLDARVSPSTVKTGEFELAGLLVSIAAKARAMKACRVVFDSLDVLLFLLNDVVTERSEIYRLHEWLLDNNLTGIITTKPGLSDLQPEDRYSFLQHMSDAVVLLHHGLVGRMATRHLSVLKYRGSNFADSEFPIVFGKAGIEVAGLGPSDMEATPCSERIATGVARLDSMMDGGYYRGSNILVSGSPGTAKSTLAGGFVRECCHRGEHVVYFCFDESGPELVRNLTSVDIDLAPFIEAGLLCMHTPPAESRNADEHLLTIRQLLELHGAKHLIIDPISALAKSDEAAGVAALRRLIRFTKASGITLFVTSLLSEQDTLIEATPIQVSTLADTWIHLSYVVQNGERNRGLTIVKSRGTCHSNQVRELILGNDGVTISDVYTSQGQVLMGTARWQQEQLERLEQENAELSLERRQRDLAAARADIQVRMERLRRQMEAQEIAEQAVHKERQTRLERDQSRRFHLRHLRGGDQPDDPKLPK